jgi:hypothetical protein
MARRLPDRLAQEFDRIGHPAGLVRHEARKQYEFEMLRRHSPPLAIERFSLGQATGTVMREAGLQQGL